MLLKQAKRHGGIVLVFVLLSLLCVSPYLYGKGMKSKPFVKWAGGKGQLIEQLDALLPRGFDSKNIVYVEPFVGGGAMLFYMLEKYPNISRAVINDMNSDLVTCYKVIKEKPEDLIEELRGLQKEYYSRKDEGARKKMFLEKRERYNSHAAGEIEESALFIFLNRTCFNGLYRVNSKRSYNVPFGKAERPLICDEETLRADSMALQKVEILCGDYALVTNVVYGEAFFYFDPPYRPLTKTAAFTAYSKGGFDDEEQKRLAEFCRVLDAMGSRWLLSNSDPHNSNSSDMFFDDLYKGFDIHRVSASRMINSKVEGRGKIMELAIRNYRD